MGSKEKEGKMDLKVGKDCGGEHEERDELHVEVKKQSSCAVHLSNVTDQYVAYKVKTTSPKKYCVRPNVGIMKPKSTCDFIVTMQAQKYTPTEMICKDKFLIQSTVVPFGTTEEEITSSMFSKDGGKYIEETKIRVALSSAPNSPEKLPAHGIIKQDQISDEAMVPEEPDSPVLLPVNGISKQASIFEYSKPEVQLLAGNENSPPTVRPIIKMDAATPTIVKEMEESTLGVQDIVKSVHTEGEECYSDKNMKSIQVKDDEATNLKLTKEINDLQLKISSLDSKLVEAECIIVKLKEERMNTIGETESLRRQLAMSKKNSSGRKVQVGFPPLFVCMIALINLVIGFMLRS